MALPAERGRRAAVLAVLAALSLSPAAIRAADEVTVPPAVQADLLARLVGYDPALVERAQGRWRFLVLRKSGDAESERAAVQFVSGLAGHGNVQGLPHEEFVEDYQDAARVTYLCLRRSVTVVYLTPGLSAEVAAVSQAVAGLGVLTVGAVPGQVNKGAAVGFDLISGKKTLLLNAAELRAKGINFSYQLLRLAKVVVP